MLLLVFDVAALAAGISATAAAVVVILAIVAVFAIFQPTNKDHLSSLANNISGPQLSLTFQR